MSDANENIYFTFIVLNITQKMVDSLKTLKKLCNEKCFSLISETRFVCPTQIQKLFISRFLFTLIHFGFLHTINLKQEEKKNFSNFDFSLSFVCLFQFLFFLSQSRTKIVDLFFLVFFCTILKESLINFRMFHWQKKEEFMNLDNILWNKLVGKVFCGNFFGKIGILMEFYKNFQIV